MNKQVDLGNGFALLYTNYRIEPTPELDKNNIKFEGLMRGQMNVFVAHSRPASDSVEVIKVSHD